MIRTQVLNGNQIKQKIERLAHEIWENYYPSKNVVLVGIKGNGYFFAQELKKKLDAIVGQNLPLFELAVNKKSPYESAPQLDADPGALQGKDIVLVDDVLNSGQTLMHACSKLLESQVNCLHTAILVNRRHRKFPIRADFVGLTLNTTLQEHIFVEEENGELVVYLG